MHSYITPDVSTPCSTACRSPPARQIVLIARMWCRCPPSIAFPVSRSTPSDVPKKRLLHVVHGERVPGEQHVHEAGADQLLEVCATRRCARRPARRRRRSARRAAFISRIMAAMRETPTSTRRSDEISFDMNAKPWRSRSWNSGITRTPATPHTTRVPDRDIAQLAAARPALAPRR